MSEPICDWTERMISKNEEFYIPVKKLWYAYRLLNPQKDISFEEYEKILRDDERFLFREMLEKERTDIPDDELEAVGYFRGPRVSLKSRQPTEEDVARSIQKTLNKLVNALTNMKEKLDPYDVDKLEEIERVIQRAKSVCSAYNEIRREK